MRIAAVALAGCLLVSSSVAQTLAAAAPATAPSGKLAHIQVDVTHRQVRVDCEAVKADYPLEFYCVVSGGNEYEAVLRSPVKPSQLHLALLMLGLEPGEGLTYSPGTQTWRPPHGPPLRLTVQWQKDGRTISVPAYRLLRSIKTKKEAAPMTWVFAGSRVLGNGVYSADQTGYLVSVVNVEGMVIDLPERVSRTMEEREWEPNFDLLPAAGTPMTLVIEPAGALKDSSGPATRAAGEEPAATHLSDVTVDQAHIDCLHQLWEKAVAPRQDALREAAQAHYEVINSLRREQQRLIDEADRIQRLIDQLEKEYQDMTTPRPETSGK